jgi:hypothetical protein
MPHRIDKDKFEQCLVDNVHMYENRVVVIDKDTAGGGHASDANIQDMIKNLKNEDSNRSLAAIAKLWYDLDENNLPHAYVLRGLNESNREDWVEDKICLLKFFENIICYEDMLCDSNDEPLVINRSVSEFEIKYAFSLARGSGSLSTPLWMNRQFVHDGNIYWYDKSSTMKMDNLKAWMIGELSARNSSEGVCNLSVCFEEYIGGKGSNYDQYLESWTNHVHDKYSQSVKHCVQIGVDWWKEHCAAMQLSKCQLQEILYHYQYAQEECEIFAGQKETMTLALKQIKEWKMFNEISDQCRLAGVCMSIVGGAGLGKSAFMAALGQKLRQLEQEKALKGLVPFPVVSRFCGLTSESSNGLSLVYSICLELFGHLNIVDRNVPLDYKGAVQCLHRLMKEHSIILLIDGLDNLTHDYQAGGNMLSFLTNVDPHVESKIIVSTRLDVKEKKSTKWKVCYGCDSRLQESSVPTIKMKPFEDVS